MRHKYVIDIENGYLCPDNAQLEIPMRKFRVDRINRTHRAVTMDFSLAQPIDDTAESVLKIERWADGAWVNMPVFPNQRDPCTKVMECRIQSIVDMYVTLGKAIGIKHPEQCGIPAGNYSVNRYPIDISSEIPFWGGRFRTTLIFRKIATNKKAFCAQCVMNVVEKPV
mgnify:CR=1 FL=1